jgi:hypothetical protein
MAANPTHGDFADILAGADPDVKRICTALRKTILKLHRGAVEVVWPRHRIASFGVGPKKMTEHYAYIGVHRAYANLGFYHGAKLADPARLLEGTGKGLRHVKVHTVAEAGRPAIAALLRKAIADREKANFGKAARS